MEDKVKCMCPNCNDIFYRWFDEEEYFCSEECEVEYLYLTVDFMGEEE